MKISKISFAVLVMGMCAFASCKKSETTTTTNSGTEQSSDTQGASGDSDPMTSPGSNIDQNGTDPSSTSMPGNDTISNDVKPKSSGNTSSNDKNSSNSGAQGTMPKDNGADPYYNGRGTVSGSKSGVHTGTGTNAGQGSSTSAPKDNTTSKS